MGQGREAGAIIDALVGWLRDHAERTGTRGFVFGLSGGIDSAVVCGLAARAVGADRCLGVVMPIGNHPEDEALGREAGGVMGVRVAGPDLLPAFDALEAAFRAERDALGLDAADAGAARLAAANIKPRLRMIALYHLANLLNYLVIGTGNKAELRVGYYTKHGDAGVDLLPLGDLTKAEVRAVAAALGVPQAIIDRPPSAGLWAGQTDEEELGLTYADIDRYLTEGSSGTPSVDADIERRWNASAHKRATPPIATLPAD